MKLISYLYIVIKSFYVRRFLDLPTVSPSANLPNTRKAENLKEEVRLEDTRLQNLEENRLEDARLQNLEETRLEDTRLPDFVEARLEEGVEDRAQEEAIQQELLDISGIRFKCLIIYRFLDS